jgi:hypothetical protein
MKKSTETLRRQVVLGFNLGAFVIDGAKETSREKDKGMVFLDRAFECYPESIGRLDKLTQQSR